MVCFNPLRNWFRKLALLCQPIRFKTKTNHDLFIPIFPALQAVFLFFFLLTVLVGRLFICSDLAVVNTMVLILRQTSVPVLMGLEKWNTMIMLIRKVKFYVRPSCRASYREIVSGANHVSGHNSLFYLLILTVASTDRCLWAQLEQVPVASNW